MKLYSKFIHQLTSLGLTLLLLFLVFTTNAQISLVSGTYSQDFNTLVSSGTSSTVPAGWLFLEVGGNTIYTAGTGSGNAGDTYSFGAAASSERAFGSLLSGSVAPILGASFTNNSGNTINSITITYTGEQWRLGTLSRPDRLDFQYSLNATNLATVSGTWTDVNALDFVAPNTGPTTGPLDGNATANKTAISSTISGLNIANLSTFFIRWVDFDATSSDDGISVDDFSISFTTASVVPIVTTFSPPSSCSEFGIPVVINGSNFAGVNSVTFNGTPVPSASIVVNGAGTQITVPLPVGATTGPIVVSNGTNSAMSAFNFIVYPIPTATVVSGGGTFCGNTTITASGGTGGSIYFQGTISGGTLAGTPSSSELISSSGTYYFRAQSAPGCWGPEGSTSVVINSAATPVTIFTESIGSVGGTTTIASHETANGFDNDGFTMSGTGDIRVTLPSSGYTGASGLANVFLTTSATNFQIANINTTVYQQFTLSFGINKNTTAGDGSDLIVEVSSDGTSYTALTFPALPTGSGTAIWHYRTASGTIPATANLRVRFRNTSAATQYRIDDISLIGSNPSSTITASGPTTFCPGGSVVLSAPNAASYLWSNNATTQNITVTTAGNYSCQLTMPNGCVLTSNLITVTVNEPASFTVCPSNITDFSPSNSCGKQANYNVTVTGSPVPVLSYSFSGATTGSGSGTGSGSFFNVGGTTVEITATNVCGPVLCTFDVIIFDITPPTANCMNATVILDANGNGTLAASQVNNGSTDNCAISSVVVNPNTFNCSNVTAAPTTPSVWINEIHYDNINTDANEFVELAGTAGINLANYSLVRYNGSAPAAAVTYTTPAQLTTLTGTIPNQSNGYGTFAVSFAVDGLQNGPNDGIALVNTLTSTVVQFLSYEGVITAANGPAIGLTSVDIGVSESTTTPVGSSLRLIGSGTSYSSYAWAPEAPASAASVNAGQTFTAPVGGNLVTLTVTDVNGISSTCTANVTVSDVTPPTANCQNITVQLDASGTASITGLQVNNNSTDACGIASYSVSPNTFTCANVGANTVTLTVTDNNNNSSTCTATVTVQDVTPPVANCQNLTVQLNGSGNASITAAQINNGSTDECGLNPTMTVTPNTFTCADVTGDPVGDLIISEYIEGNVGSNKYIEIFNGTSGSINLNNYRLRLYANGSATTSNDVLLSGILNAGQTIVYQNAAATIYGGSVTNNAAVNYNGDDAVALFKISTGTNVDIIGRIGQDPGSAWTSGSLSTADQTLRRKATVTQGVTTNPASGFPTLATEWDSFTPGDVSGLGSHIINGGNLVTLTVTDVNGNSSTCTAYVTVQDVTNPAISVCAPDQNVNLNGTCQLTVPNLVAQTTAGDNCSVTVTQSPIAGTLLPSSQNQAHNVIITATDPSGNFVTCITVLTGIDNTNPSITICAPNQNVNLNGSCQLVVPDLVAQTTATDNCTVTITQSPIAGTPLSSSNNQPHTVTITATDAAGNFVTCTTILTGKDVSNPVITICAPNQNVNLNGSCQLVVPDLVAQTTATDNCTVTITQSPIAGTPLSSSNNQTHTITITATDAAGNFVTCTTILTGKDVSNAVITVCAPNQNVNLNGGCQLVVPNLVAQTTALDNCLAVVTVTQSPIAGTILPSSHNQMHSVLITATDVAGNITTCTTVLTGKDVTNPSISCPGNITVSNTPGICGANVTYSAPTASDNCTYTITQTNGNASGSVFPIGTTVNTFVATDAAGNSSTCSFSVTVNDTQAPYLAPGSSCPNSFTACNPVSWVAPIFIDNCPGVQTISNHSPGSQFQEGTTIVTYTATDLKGNSSSCTFTVTVLDTSEAATSITSNRDFNNICSGGDITLTVNGGHLGLVSVGVPAQWKWYRNGCGSPSGVLVGTGPSLTVAPTTTTTYYVRPEGACNTPACVSITVTVSTGNPSGSPVYSSVPTQGAPGVTDVISVVPVPGATFYQWSTTNGHINSVLFNGNLSPELTSVPSVNITFVLPLQNYQIRVLAGNACGRTGQANTHIRGTVSAPTSMTGPTQVCPGTPVTYGIQAIPPVSGNSPVTYNWSLIPTSAGTITMAPNGLSATVNFAAGFGSAQVCANGVSSFGLPGLPYCLNVTSSAPVPGVISGQQSPCINNAYQYSIASVPGASTYNWSTNIGVVQSVAVDGLSAVILFPNSSFTNKSVCVTASSLCGTSAPSCLTINSGTPGDPGDINGTAHGVCGASGVNYYLNTSDANSYLWTVTANMDIPGVATNNSVSVDFLPGFTSGTVTVTAFYNCGQVVKNFDVEGSPIPPIILPTAVCPNSTQIFFVSNIDVTATYTWTINGDIIDDYCTGGNCTQYYIETGNGGGTFEVIPSNNCGVGDPVFSEVCRIAAPKTEIDIYPNPTTGILTLEFNSKSSGQYNIKVTDLSGRAVLITDLKAVAGRNKHEIDLSSTNAGVYMIYIKDSNNNFIVQKIVIE